MTPEHDEQLCKAFPVLYRDRYLGATKTCMAWGFTCGDGWFQLIYDLSQKLETHIQDNLRTRLVKYLLPVAAQVKEKFGVLCYYLDNGDEIMEATISEARRLSAVTCEKCGGPGRLQKGSWLRTMCDPCEAKQHIPVDT